MRVNKMAVLRNAMGIEGQEQKEDHAAIRDMILNASTMRSQLLSQLLDPRRDIDSECGYPSELTPQQYKLMYDREGVATRVVSLFPEESWGVDPEIYESEKATGTPFEEAWKELEKEHQIYSYLSKVDVVSGIGRFGLLLLGIDDGKPLSAPVDGVDEFGNKTGNHVYKLLYLRVFDESVVKIQNTEKDFNSPRFGKPTMYSIAFDASITSVMGESTNQIQSLVHWTRVIHVADNRQTSEVFGVPRMQTVFNRLYDLRKVAGGSGEMFWKGGFPGYSFEMDSGARPLDASTKAELKEELFNYANGLQRYLALQGVKANSLSPQVADPRSHVDVQILLICIALGVPRRIFEGSEEAKLASFQDVRTWNKRLKKRQNKYLSSWLIRPVVNRLIAFGILPEPVDGFLVFWPDLDSPSDDDRATVLVKMVDAFSKYVNGNVEQLIPADLFLSMFANLTTEQIEEIMEAARKREKDLEVDEDLDNEED